jgi:nicotinate-nucleotide adenylyltransferase
MKRVALFGGSFNPPHIGHLMAATYMRSVRAVDEVWLVPAWKHPFDKALPAFDLRVAWCEAMASDSSAWLKVSRAEASVGKDGRTIDLLEYLLPLHPTVTFQLVIGSDILGELGQWKAWDRIESLVEVVVLYRAGFPADRAVGPPLALVSSSMIRARLEANQPADDVVPHTVLALLNAQKVEVSDSSTAKR